VKSPNPANPIEVPLVNSWWLSKKKGKEAWVRATVRDGRVHYEVVNDANGPKGTDDGSIDRRGAVSIADGTPIPLDYIRGEAQAHRMGAHLLAVVGESKSGRIYVSPDDTHMTAAAVERPSAEGEAQLPVRALGFRVQNYGFHKWFDLFTNRQLVALTTFSDLVGEARQRVLEDALAAGMEEGESLEAGGAGARAYADATRRALRK
jgi:putative DNA methylase